jgi:metallo-beta-lactamase family protein
MNQVTVTFLGGADTVTGSKYLVAYGRHRLMVDCGLFQGYKQLRLRNWNPLPVVPNQIDAVVLTHAHLDHSGYLPLLTKEGFRGKIHCTDATKDLCGILLPDSGYLQEEDAYFANRHGFSKHSPALPLYTREDAVNCLGAFKAHPFSEVFEPIAGWRVSFSRAGHILGAASVLLEVGGKQLLFSGDLGRQDDLLMKAPDHAKAADAIFIESTYGDQLHPPEGMLPDLARALTRVCERGGVAVVPVFAVGRAQALMHAIAQLKEQGDIPHGLPVFLDSPMAVSTTGLMSRHMADHRLSARQVHAMTQGVTMVSSPDESKALGRRHGPMVVLSASGMATGGRVLHHLALHAPNHRNMVILTGHQAPGTRGARLAAGEPSIRIHGREVEVRAEVVQLASASAHADANELLDWLKSSPRQPKQVFVVHGDMEASDTLRARIEHELHWFARVPEHGSVVAID